MSSLLTTASAQAQVTAQFSVAQIPVPTGSLSYPYRVAVDAAGSLYISDTQNNRVLKETLAPNGGYTETVVASTGLATPYGGWRCLYPIRLTGAAATVPFTAAPEGALTFPNPVTFSVTGLPPPATAVLTPATIPAWSATTPVSLVVQTPSAVAAEVREPMRGVPHGSAPVELALLFLPILGLQAFRKQLRLATSTRAAVLLATLAIGAAAALAGCTRTTRLNSTSYPLVVTATRGTLHTSFNMTLIVDK